MTVRRNEADASWAELARLDPLAAVLDPADAAGAKNRAIDRVHKRALRRTVRNLRGKAVLDFGCGTGRLSDWLVTQGAIVEGVDVTPEMVEVARRRVSHARFQVIEGPMLPFPDGRFELVITAYVLQYYVHDDRTMHKELTRVLCPGGRLVAIEQVAADDIGRGGTIQAYERMLEEGGTPLVEARTIRVGDSRIIGAVQRHPALCRVPALPRLIEWEARFLRDLPLTSGRYADVVFVAEKDLPLRALRGAV
jgi:SAM-dependent methyltransferase